MALIHGHIDKSKTSGGFAIHIVGCPALLQADMVKPCVSSQDCQSDEQCCRIKNTKYCTTSLSVDTETISMYPC